MEVIAKKGIGGFNTELRYCHFSEFRNHYLLGCRVIVCKCTQGNVLASKMGKDDRMGLVFIPQS